MLSANGTGRGSHHGRLSSASTGRFAALRLPFAVLSEEKVMSLDCAGASTSISSSKSDILKEGRLLGARGWKEAENDRQQAAGVHSVEVSGGSIWSGSRGVAKSRRHRVAPFLLILEWNARSRVRTDHTLNELLDSTISLTPCSCEMSKPGLKNNAFLLESLTHPCVIWNPGAFVRLSACTKMDFAPLISAYENFPSSWRFLFFS